ncbi:hypothetical protein BH23BAC4_BH23BAC4_10300 [soil metagenome]
MTGMLDHLSAALVGGVILLLLLSMTTHQSEVAMERTALYAAKAHLLSFTQWLEEDIDVVGLNIGERHHRFAAPEDQDGVTRRFTFYRDSITVMRDTVRVVTRYDVEPTAETFLVRGEELPLLTLRRSVAYLTPGQSASTALWQTAGAGPSTLTAFSVDMLRRDGAAVGSPAETDLIRVRFAVAAALTQENAFLREFHWTTTKRVRPI